MSQLERRVSLKEVAARRCGVVCLREASEAGRGIVICGSCFSNEEGAMQTCKRRQSVPSSDHPYCLALCHLAGDDHGLPLLFFAFCLAAARPLGALDDFLPLAIGTVHAVWGNGLMWIRR